jgi:hypothetical protein
MSEITRHTPTASSGSVVDRVINTHPEYDRAAPLWEVVQDCIEGEHRIKAQGDKYLPRPNVTDTSEANKARFAQYVLRAVFYNVTKRTLQGLVGRVFAKDETVMVPTVMEPMLENVDGSGISLMQQAKDTMEKALSVSRCGLMVDFPAVEGVVTRKDEEEGGAKPTILLYGTENIINWKTKKTGSEEKLSLVVLKESTEVGDNEFSHDIQLQYRQLYIDSEDNTFKVKVWRLQSNDAVAVSTNGGNLSDYAVHEEYTPTDASGNPFDEILFTFVGSLNNDPTVDQPLMLDIANLNVAHYRNSADYEEAAFIVGQPTPYFTGLTPEWVEDVMKGKVQFGSRAGIPLPEGSSAGLLQAASNTMIKEAMDTKENQMVALGARLLESSSTQRTATEANLDNVEEVSNLISVAGNVSEAYKTCLRWVSQFVSGAEEEIAFELNTDFSNDSLTSQELQALVSTWQTNGISWVELRHQLKKAGLATEEDEDAKGQIESEEGFFGSVTPDPSMTTPDE